MKQVRRAREDRSKNQFLIHRGDLTGFPLTKKYNKSYTIIYTVYKVVLLKHQQRPLFRIKTVFILHTCAALQLYHITLVDAPTV